MASIKSVRIDRCKSVVWFAGRVAQGMAAAVMLLGTLSGTAASAALAAVPAALDRLGPPAHSGTVESSTVAPAAAAAAAELLRLSNCAPCKAESCTTSYCWTSVDCSRTGKQPHGTTADADCTTSGGRWNMAATRTPADCTRCHYDRYRMHVMAAATAIVPDIYSSIFSYLLNIQ